MRIFLCGDVMTGRGVDQVLPHPCDPRLYEASMKSAAGYVALAARVSGPIVTPVDFSYVWGAALDEWQLVRPDLRIVNLETAITRKDAHADKGINYRMSPENAACLSVAKIDCCILANNHVLDWERAGLIDTLGTLERLGIKTAGAGRNSDEANASAILTAGAKGRVLVFAYALRTAGVPSHWAATKDAAGIDLLPSLSDTTVAMVADRVAAVRQPGDAVIISLHWGPNWGYVVSDEQRAFAHAMIDKAGASIVHGHSSHHVMPIEIYRNRLILYGCGDFLNDYEGIEGHAHFRPDLSLMYFADLDPKSLDVAVLALVPLKIRRFRLERAGGEDIAWLQQTLGGLSRCFNARVTISPEGRLMVANRTE
jgi:poly-gamma-glutamate capsule biosynthesis protein CapA/YwtB (metallophosphatase superfamily)